jgi:hypothetical protein
MGRLPWIFLGVFGAVGLGLLGGALFAMQSTLAFQEGALVTPGTVVAVEGGKPVVEFEDRAGETHRVWGTVSSNPPAYERGERVEVRYRPGAPDQARIDGFLENWFVSLVLGGLGTVFTGVGAGFGVAQLRRRRLHAWLRQFGVQVQAKYTGAHLDGSVRVNRRHPWRLTAQWQNPADGVVHTFESEMLFFDPSEFVQRETVDVWIDPSDPGRHLLDVSFLPKHAG